MKLVPAGGGGTVTWITDLDRDAVFAEFKRSVSAFRKGKRLVDRPCVTVAREPNACWRQGAEAKPASRR
jgi:hypothetical protein